ncbi:DUF4174 domain-containing protein [Methylopila musalis]|uniref:DUF4174 domain-containing protein n=1 Tax=Methylopila musalis TaxID=1134781 RepID=A0ABW3Z6P3_9HYPH
MSRPTAVSTLALTLAILAPSAVFAGALDAFRDRARPVIVFTPDAGQPAAREQIENLTRARAALDERQMSVFVVGPRAVTTLSGGRAPSALAADDLRKTYDVAADAFAVVLIGKDGGEKFRATEPVTADALTARVDEMPMRKNETR